MVRIMRYGVGNLMHTIHCGGVRGYITMTK